MASFSHRTRVSDKYDRAQSSIYEFYRFRPGAASSGIGRIEPQADACAQPAKDKQRVH
jgi:hypothetical protein